jgi:hypothetical protein
MNSSEDLAPLCLLSKLQGPELADIIRTSVAGNAGMMLTPVEPTNDYAFELVFSGVAFNLSVTTEPVRVSGFKHIFCNLDSAQVGSGLDIALGGHVAGGERVPAIIRTLLGLAIELGGSIGAVASIWRPANIMSGFAFFEESVESYLSGGAFPVLALIDFKTGIDDVITTTGLRALSGQDLQIECGILDKVEIMRRAVRVSHDLAVNGPILSKTTLNGLSPGETLELVPNSEAGLLKMTSCSVLDV